MRTIVLAALFAAAVTSSAGAGVVGTMQLNGTTAVVTDDRTAPGPGYTLLGCGVTATGKQACTWGVGPSAPSAPAIPASVVIASNTPPARSVPDVNVADQGNPMIGGVQPDAQMACQWGSTSARCASVRPKATAFDWTMGIGSLFILGEEVSHGGGFCCSTIGGNSTWNGTIMPPGGQPYVPGGQRRQ